MEQNTQSNESNSQAETNAGNGQIFNEPRKKSSKKIVLLIGVVMIIFGAVALYFLFFSDKEDDSAPVLENEEVEIDKELDSDQDGLPDYIEEVLGTDAISFDTDGDGYSDFEEIKNGYDPVGDKKYTEGEWEEVREKIKSKSDKLYNDIFVVEKKKTINFSQFIETCRDIENESLKSSCINSACDLIISKEEKIRNCLNNDVDLYKDLCLMMIVPQTMEVCDNLSGSLYKDECYLAAVGQTEDISICEKISDDISIKVSCYKNLAMAKNDSEICQKIDYNYFKEWCTANSTKDFSICRSLKDGTFHWDEAKLDDWKNICLGAVTGDVNYCEKINEESVKPSCYKDVAVRRNDLSICDKLELSNDSDKDECYMRIATKREASSLCDLLGDKFRKQCHNQISIQKANFSFCRELSEAEQSLCYYSSMLRALNYFDINQDEGLTLCEEVE